MLGAMTMRYVTEERPQWVKAKRVSVLHMNSGFNKSQKCLGSTAKESTILDYTDSI